MQRVAIAYAALAAVVSASPAALPQLDLNQLQAAPTVATGPTVLVADADGYDSAPVYTSLTITAVATPQATGAAKFKRGDDGVYTPYYAALATSYTTDPALAASKTTTAGQPCVTNPEAGTYCGFINPLDPCAPQPDGYGPVPSPDTAPAFLAFDKLHALAKAAPTKIPSLANTQYTQVFKDLNGAVSANSYIGLFTLKTYSATECAAKCDANTLCTSFNIYAERDPSLNPTNNDSTYDPGYPTVWGQNCPNPASMTSYKCTLWGSQIDASICTNTGVTLQQFKVVVTASNGYDRTTVATPPDCVPIATSPTTKPPTTNPWKKPENCKGKGINAPKYSMGSKFFPGPFNPQVCSNFALLQNAVNAKANKSQCQMFNAYYLNKNGSPFGTYCSLYSTYLSASTYATIGTTSGSGSDKYDCKQSWTYTLSVSVSTGTTTTSSTSAFNIFNPSTWFSWRS